MGISQNESKPHPCTFTTLVGSVQGRAFAESRPCASFVNPPVEANRSVGLLEPLGVKAGGAETTVGRVHLVHLGVRQRHANTVDVDADQVPPHLAVRQGRLVQRRPAVAARLADLGLADQNTILLVHLGLHDADRLGLQVLGGLTGSSPVPVASQTEGDSSDHHDDDRGDRPKHPVVRRLGFHEVSSR